MPLRVEEEDRQLQGTMETALVEGLQEKYEVFAGEVVSKKRERFFSRNCTKRRPVLSLACRLARNGSMFEHVAA